MELCPAAGTLKCEPPPFLITLSKVFLSGLGQNWDNGQLTAQLVHVHASAGPMVAAAVTSSLLLLWEEEQRMGRELKEPPPLLFSMNPPRYQKKFRQGGTDLSSKLLRKMTNDFKFKTSLAYKTSLRTT